MRPPCGMRRPKIPETHYSKEGHWIFRPPQQHLCRSFLYPRAYYRRRGAMERGIPKGMRVGTVEQMILGRKVRIWREAIRVARHSGWMDVASLTWLDPWRIMLE